MSLTSCQLRTLPSSVGGQGRKQTVLSLLFLASKQQAGDGVLIAALMYRLTCCR